MVELKFHCCMPIFIARQWIRHRTANVNEYSGRYWLIPMLFYTPEEAQLQTQSRHNNQGRSGQAVTADLHAEAVRRWHETRQRGAEAYEWLTGNEVARELARIDLPLSTYTQWYWKIDLHNLLHFLTLRVDAHAQWEIQEYGRVMAGMLKRVAPLSYEAWIDYDVCGGQLSRMELDDAALAGRRRGHTVTRARLARQGGPGRARPVQARDRGALGKLRAPGPVPDFSLDPAQARSAEFFAERFADAVPTADKSPTD